MSYQRELEDIEDLIEDMQQLLKEQGHTSDRARQAIDSMDNDEMQAYIDKHS